MITDVTKFNLKLNNIRNRVLCTQKLSSRSISERLYTREKLLRNFFENVYSTILIFIKPGSPILNKLYDFSLKSPICQIDHTKNFCLVCTLR